MSTPESPYALMIDATTTRDRDDAITVTPTPSGGWEVAVFVANVADLVPAGSPADRAAATRVETRYRAKGTTPMLGAQLEQAATLSATRERDVVAVRLAVSADGDITLTGISREVLVAGSCVALSHSDVTAALADSGHVHHAQLSSASALVRVLTGRRRAAGAFVVYDVTRGLVSGEDGRLVSLPEGHNAAAYVIVQELMIAANTAVARYAIDAELPILFRNHLRNPVAPADVDRLADLAAALSTVTTTAELAALQGQLNTAISKAAYGAVVRGHIGLQLPAYTHATSPLRRYADLVTQRQLLAHLDGTEPPYTAEQLATIGDALAAITAERDADSETAQKARTRRANEAAIAAGTMSHMNDREFLRVLRLGTQAAPPASIATELTDRATTGRLHSGHIAVLYTADHPDWKTLRATLTAQLRAEHAYLSVSVLSAWQQIDGGQLIAPTFDTDITGPPHQRSFATRAHLEDMTTRWHIGPVKKATEQAAVWELLDILGGHLPSADPMAPPPEPDPVATAPAPVIEMVGESTVGAPIATAPSGTWDAVALAAALGADETQRARRRAKALSNPVGWLTTLATTISAGELHVDTHVDGPPHQRIFTVTLTAGPATATATGATIKTAKTAAAHTAITNLFDNPPLMSGNHTHVGGA
ncbi:ribonuclease catalytic domain-containing protein [Gordonia amicalis]|uniref:ribonuclease catalytic domain-containing protein n=1 Tax=Gordonia amicalis TaxID=89053 RepID=UPI0022B4EB9B|nr:ribonuclease catalytic domain-containing protein [Gordonia amicalis]MCZ4581715.1 ribonuclease catalytic domain-containing protein [Gordonia amicalis]